MLLDMETDDETEQPTWRHLGGIVATVVAGLHKTAEGRRIGAPKPLQTRTAHTHAGGKVASGVRCRALGGEMRAHQAASLKLQQAYSPQRSRAALS